MSRSLPLRHIYDLNDAYQSVERCHQAHGKLPVEFIRMRQPEIEAHFGERSDFAVVFGWEVKGETLVDFGESQKRLDGPTGFYVNPIGGEFWFRQSHSMEALVISVQLDMLADSLSMKREVFAHAVRPLHDCMFVDPQLADSARRLWLTAERDGPFASLAVDHGFIGLICALLDKSATYAHSDESAVPLSSGELERCFEFIEVCLDQPIGLNDIGNVIKVPPSRVISGIKTATGQTPHQYVLSRRIARAQELLAAGAMPLAEIAYACGFASQSHMTDVFRQKLGVTPGRYRKEVRG